MFFVCYYITGDYMKVISIREPYASLIKDGVKTIETRSWKTKYRGPIYIHSCMSKHIIKKDVKKLIKSELKYGYILCKAELVDCIYMDEEFIEKEKNRDNNNFICGRYEVGRYAWVLDNIEILNERKKNKGQLGLWNYDK